jgi:hypothetical protein
MTVSYAQSLRVIGQALEKLRIHAFVLEKQIDKFVVRNWEPSFLRNIADDVWGLGNSSAASRTKESNDLLAYDNSDTERLETIGRASRGNGDIHGSYGISSGLRVVGDYLDSQKTVAFSIWWSTESVTVKYNGTAGGPKETNFAVQNLQDLKVEMYLRRSSGQDGKSSFAE